MKDEDGVVTPSNLVVVSEEQKLSIYDIKKRSEIKSFNIGSEKTTIISLSIDGRLLAKGSPTGIITIENLEDET